MEGGGLLILNGKTKCLQGLKALMSSLYIKVPQLL